MKRIKGREGERKERGTEGGVDVTYLQTTALLLSLVIVCQRCSSIKLIKPFDCVKYH